jgi:hypothetical protein
LSHQQPLRYGITSSSRFRCRSVPLFFFCLLSFIDMNFGIGHTKLPFRSPVPLNDFNPLESSYFKPLQAAALKSL